MNEVMKLLTDFDDFYPLTLLRNIRHELQYKYPLEYAWLNWYWGYPLCFGRHGSNSGLVIFFWQRGWFENFRRLRMIPSWQQRRYALNWI